MAFNLRARKTTSPADQREAVTFLVLFLLAVLPYANSLFGNFVYDDGAQILDNPYVHSFQYLPQIFGTTVWSFQGAQGLTNYYRPLMSLGYLLCYQIAGAVPFSFHLVNLLLNALVVWLLFCVLRRLSGERVAMIAAGLFALHPIHTESVAWISGVTDLELASFYLLTFLLYLRLSDAKGSAGPRALMCATFALALLSKEQAMTLPVLAMIFEHFYRDDRSETTLRQKASRYAPLWVVTGLYLAVRAALLGGIAGVILHPALSWYEVALTAISLIGGYLAKLVWPADLSAFYVFHQSSRLSDPGVLLGIFGLAVCGALFLLLWRRAHTLSFALIWMFLTLAPVLNARWMPASVFAERYLYLPSVGFCWILAWAAVKLWRTDALAASLSLSRAVPVILVVIAMLYGVRTITRNRDWRSDETLYARTLDSQKDASLILTNMGAILFDRAVNSGDYADAEHVLLQSLAAGPNNVFALGDLGLLRARQHRYNEALDYFHHAIRLRPVYASAHMDLANTLAEMGRAPEAEWQYRVAVTLAPLSTRAHNSYGKFLFAAGRLDDARAEYDRSVRVDPTTDAYNRLGDIYVAWKDERSAEAAFRHAIALNPFDSRAHFSLGKILEAQGKPGDALYEIEHGLETDPSDAEAKAAEIRLRGSAPPVSQNSTH